MEPTTIAVSAMVFSRCRWKAAMKQRLGAIQGDALVSEQHACRCVPNDKKIAPDDMTLLINLTVKRFQMQALGGCESQFADDLRNPGDSGWTREALLPPRKLSQELHIVLGQRAIPDQAHPVDHHV